MSSPELGLVVRLGLVTGITGFLVAVLTTVIAISTSSVTTAVVVRAFLVSLLVFLASRAVVNKLTATDEEAGMVVKVVVAGLAVGYVLDLAWWGGHAHSAQLFIEQPVLRVAVDGLLWMGSGSVSLLHSLRRGQGSRHDAGLTYP